MTVASYTVQVAWDTASFTNISSDVVKINISRSLWSLFDSVSPGEAQIEVINVSGKYTPDNSASPFAGLMKNGRELRIFGSLSAGTSLQMFQGFLDQISLPANDWQNGRVLLSFRDRSRELRHRTINTSLWVDYNITSLFSNVLGAAGVSSEHYSVAEMPDEADLGWFRDQSADSAITDMIAFNFSKGLVSRTGVITILDRYYDQGLTNVQSYNQFLSLDYSLTDDGVINDATFESDPREIGASSVRLSHIIAPITIPASSSVAFVMEYIDPVTKRGVPAVNMVVPVSSLHYIAGTTPTSGAADATATTSVAVQFFGETAVSTVFNGTGASVYLNKYELYGQHIPEASKLQAVTISSSSQSVYGKRSFFLSSRLLGDREYLAGYGAYLVDRQKDPIPSIRAALRNEVTSASITLDPGSVISISNSDTAVGSLHFLKRLEHDIDMSAGVQHTISMEMERVVEYQIWTLNATDGTGNLDSGNELAF